MHQLFSIIMDELDKTIDNLKAMGFDNKHMSRLFVKNEFVTDTLCYQITIEFFNIKDFETISEDAILTVHFGDYQACSWVSLFNRRKPVKQKIEDFLLECYREVADKMVKAASFMEGLSMTLV